MKQLVMETTILKGSEVTGQRYETGLIPDVKNFEMEVINLYPQKSYQTIEGFGAALTEGAEPFEIWTLSEEALFAVKDRRELIWELLPHVAHPVRRMEACGCCRV